MFRIKEPPRLGILKKIIIFNNCQFQVFEEPPGFMKEPAQTHQFWADI
jgi:hypothetical protein